MKWILLVVGFSFFFLLLAWRFTKGFWKFYESEGFDGGIRELEPGTGEGQCSIFVDGHRFLATNRKIRAGYVAGVWDVVGARWALREGVELSDLTKRVRSYIAAKWPRGIPAALFVIAYMVDLAYISREQALELIPTLKPWKFYESEGFDSGIREIESSTGEGQCSMFADGHRFLATNRKIRAGYVAGVWDVVGARWPLREGVKLSDLTEDVRCSYVAAKWPRGISAALFVIAYIVDLGYISREQALELIPRLKSLWPEKAG